MTMKYHIHPAAAITAALLLAGCNSQPETVTAGAIDPDAQAVAAAPPVELPPALAASKTYRCKDNSVVYVDFLSDSKTAQLRTEKAGAPTVLTAAEPGKAFVAEGYALSGNGDAVELTRPGAGAQSCKG